MQRLFSSHFTSTTQRSAALWAGVLATVTLTACAPLIPPPTVDLHPQTSPPVVMAPIRGNGTPTGGLFHSASFRPMFEDRRARMVGDTVTVVIIENVSASQKSSSTVDRNAAANAGITNLPLIGTKLNDKANLGATTGNKFEGKGGTESANTFTGSITATVVEVLPNGHMVIVGEKQIGVNHNVDVLRFSGTVDPRALQPGSMINSTQVANTRVESRGRGAQGEAQALGWLTRIFNNVTPF